jgi:hypothetical protein
MVFSVLDVDDVVSFSLSLSLSLDDVVFGYVSRIPFVLKYCNCEEYSNYH